MHKPVSSKHLEGVSDLTLSAPIKQGFIDAFETVTYETRLRTIMKALFRIRSTAREHSQIKPFVDTAERIQSLLDFRLAIHGKELLLAATFDKPFEPYIRLIWDPLGPLLDVIFCNCEGYVTATEHSFEEYLAWVRKSQIDTNFFYAASGHSITDIQYLTQIEKLQREARRRYRASAVTADDPIKVAEKVRADQSAESCQLGMEALVALYKLTDFYPPDRPDGKYLLWSTQQLLEKWGKQDLSKFKWHGLVADQLAWLNGEGAPQKRAPGNRLSLKKENLQGGILTNYGDQDKSVLHGALLLMRITDAAQARAYLKRLIDYPPEKVPNTGQEAAAEAASPEVPEQEPGADTAAAKSPPEPKDLIDRLRIRTEAGPGSTAVENTFLNVAFTRHGLRNIGLPQAEYDRLPQEFREGMEERAGLLGDVRDNHPRRWQLPPRYRQDAPAPADESMIKAFEVGETDGAGGIIRPQPATPEEARLIEPPGAPAATNRPDVAEAPVEMSEVDVVITLRTVEERADPYVPPGKGQGRIDEIVQRFARTPGRGLELLAVEPMRRAPQNGPITGVDHFGFKDGISQPNPAPADPADRDAVPPGEIFLGYSNGRTDGPSPPSAILDDGTFLVVRKLSQGVGRLKKFVKEEAQRLTAAGTPIGEDDLLAKMMGRFTDGRTLVAPNQSTTYNRFDYHGDRSGRLCPFQSHVRRANPRETSSGANARPTPRILRRGLSYGPPYSVSEDIKHDDDRRGVFFMAYNASIAEQFEVIQRWISGGNSTKVASWQSDPLMGVGQEGDPRTFRFVHGGKTCRVNIPDPFVKLRWGAYLFVPSISGLRAIAGLAPDLQSADQAVELEQARRGEEIVSRLLALAAEGPEGRIAAGAAWKNCLEDFAAKDPAEKDEANAVWAAIRLYHAGALKVPYGLVPPRETPRDAVLVASKDLVMRVLRNQSGDYSMSGMMERMKQSFGEIFLGMDAGEVYDEKSKINGTISRITERQAFELARAKALKALAIAFQVKQLVQVPRCKIDLRRHLLTPALADICHDWFGIPDVPSPASDRLDNFVDPWGWTWQPAETRKARCPGDYMAASRFCFYPDPIPRVRAFGKSHGQALRKTIRDYFDTLRPPGPNGPGVLAPLAAPLPPPPAPLPDPLPHGFLTTVMAPMFTDNDELASNVIGVMTGFLPPADGCMRWALYEWIEEKTLPRVQHDLISAEGDPYERASERLRPWLERAMQKRPAPDLVWRTATCGHRLGDAEVAEGDRIFVGLVSALAEDAAAGITDVYPIFGGQRGRADSPLHACPGYKAAMGTMLGILSGLLDSFRIEPLPATMLVEISEPSMAIRGILPRIDGIARAIMAAAQVDLGPPATDGRTEDEDPPYAEPVTDEPDLPADGPD